ncbi:MAG TPA: hypothetical protein VHG33_07455 [Woeseiaceae bacterium]|nr:hypothetical protein [Woeseiaceae bacterium]
MRRILTRSAPANVLVLVLLACGGGAAAQGTEFNLSCHAGEVLVGISGRQGWWMEGIAARCRSVETNGALGASIRSTEYAGGTTGTLRTFDCSPAEVMVGYSGVQGDNGYVLHVQQVFCAPWQVDTRMAGTPVRTVSAFDRKSAPGRSMAQSCPDGRVGTRLRGRAGRYLDKLIDIGCSYAGGAHPTVGRGKKGREPIAGPERAS